MSPLRRALLAAGAGAPWARAQTPEPPSQAPAQAPAMAPRPLAFPRDHGAHGEYGIEWWYATGWLQPEGVAADATPAFGFQLTFFRSRTGLADGVRSRFAARQLLFAHAALSDVAARQLLHAERIARWNGDEAAPRAAATASDTRVHIGDWRFVRDAASGRYDARLADDAAGFGFELTLAPTQPLLLQGDAGFSRKGPRPDNASFYYSQPQLAVAGRLVRGGATVGVRGRAWLDHEWSGSLMPERAVGWDWIGINLDDGGALTAFRLRDAQGRTVWAGGSHRAAGGAVRAFAADEVAFEPLERWTSAATGAAYPVRWRLRCPAGVFDLRALFEAQELDGRASTGSVYWEGLSTLHREGEARRAGVGYLEMTGYASPLRI